MYKKEKKATNTRNNVKRLTSSNNNTRRGRKLTQKMKTCEGTLHEWPLPIHHFETPRSPPPPILVSSKIKG